MRKALILLTFFPALVYADYAAGLRSYQAGDYASALAQWRPLAVQGDAAAQNGLGWLYQNGSGVRQDYVQATAWYRKSAEQGYAAAQTNLGARYEYGNGVPLDSAQAVVWYRKAADQGYPAAQARLCWLYQSGNVPKDHVQAYMWCSLASANGEPKGAQFRRLIEKTMTSPQIAEAQLHAAEWKPQIADRRSVSSRDVTPMASTAAEQTAAVVGSGAVQCAQYQDSDSWTAAPITGAIFNQTQTMITDLELELSIIGRNTDGTLKRVRDTRAVVVPSLSPSGMVAKLGPNGSIYFSIPGRSSDYTCSNYGGRVPNVAALYITRINRKSVLTAKQAPFEKMLTLKASRPAYIPTQEDRIRQIQLENSLIESTIINKQLKDCNASETWACSFNAGTTINVVLSGQ